MKYDIGVIIGRFQPFHNAHLELLKQASLQCKNLLILVGSANRAKTFKDPLTYDQRHFMISNVIRNEIDVGYLIRPLNDHMYNDVSWVSGVNSEIADAKESFGFENNSVTISIFGHDKDDSSYYLDLFPQYELELIPSLHEGLSATNVRKAFYNDEEYSHMVPSLVNSLLGSFITEDMTKEYHFIEKYKSQFSSTPYPPVFITTDALVYYKGHVLMIRRGGYPGKGQWALPGGFLEQNIRIKDSMLKELKEETKIRVAEPILRSNIRKIETFDHPGRSLRGRTVTHCGLIILDPVTSLQSLPYVKGSDDASFARWFAINEIEDIKDKIFEDHYFIIKSMLHLS